MLIWSIFEKGQFTVKSMCRQPFQNRILVEILLFQIYIFKNYTDGFRISNESTCYYKKMHLPPFYVVNWEHKEKIHILSCLSVFSSGPEIPHHFPPLSYLHCGFKLYFGLHCCRETSSWRTLKKKQAKLLDFEFLKAYPWHTQTIGWKDCLTV